MFYYPVISFITHTLTHTHTHKFRMLFRYCGRSNLIFLYFMIEKHTVWHGGCHTFGQALCDILSARKRLGRPQQQFLCRYTIYIKDGSVQCVLTYDKCLDIVMMRCTTHQEETGMFCWAFQQQFLLWYHFHKSWYCFPYFMVDILITKRFRVV